MSDPDRLTSHDDTALGRDTRGLILRIIVVAFLAALFWHTVIAAVTAGNVSSIDALSAGDQLLPRRMSSHTADLDFESGPPR